MFKAYQGIYLKIYNYMNNTLKRVVSAAYEIIYQNNYSNEINIHSTQE